ncbi:MAG: hypothetical protein KAV87_44985 [Desulfobacteraceae bacterium]|nr:hypothetical protein [Desulfobacteraceae bacterium]
MACHVTREKSSAPEESTDLLKVALHGQTRGDINLGCAGMHESRGLPGGVAVVPPGISRGISSRARQHCLKAVPIFSYSVQSTVDTVFQIKGRNPRFLPIRWQVSRKPALQPGWPQIDDS